VPKDKKDCTWEEKTSEQAGHIDPEPAEKP
jgi:hypothetical protein